MTAADKSIRQTMDANDEGTVQRVQVPEGELWYVESASVTVHGDGNNSQVKFGGGILPPNSPDVPSTQDFAMAKAGVDITGAYNQPDKTGKTTTSAIGAYASGGDYVVYGLHSAQGGTVDGQLDIRRVL